MGPDEYDFLGWAVARRLASVLNRAVTEGRYDPNELAELNRQFEETLARARRQAEIAGPEYFGLKGPTSYAQAGYTDDFNQQKAFLLDQKAEYQMNRARHYMETGEMGPEYYGQGPFKPYRFDGADYSNFIGGEFDSRTYGIPDYRDIWAMDRQLPWRDDHWEYGFDRAENVIGGRKVWGADVLQPDGNVYWEYFTTPEEAMAARLAERRSYPEKGYPGLLGGQPYSEWEATPPSERRYYNY